jgi:hypothetical protein
MSSDLTQQRRRNPGATLLLVAMLGGGACNGVGVGSFGGRQEAPAATPAVPAADAGPLAAFIDEIPPADVPALDLQTALTLVAMPLSCLDRPHAAARDRSTYLDEFVAARRPDYERNRAFYGCWDWHSAVNSTWAMVRLYKEFPELPIGGLVEEKLRDHLSGQAMQGELEFFNENRGFEQPYGYAWLLELYAELRTWNHPDAPRWANNVEPLANLFSERMVQTLPRQDRPSRSGAHSNTAFALAMMLDAARTLDDVPLQDAIMEAAPRLYGEDFGCPTAYEPWGADFLSPCLEEAALMAAVLEGDAFVAWFDRFMPAVTAREFLPLTTPVYHRPPADTGAGEAADGASEREGAGRAGAGARAGVAAASADPDTPPPSERGGAGGEADEAGTADDAGDEEGESDALRELASRSHLIGLAFIRADAMNRIAAALPAGDPRVEAYRRLAALHGSLGFAAMFDADYAGSHWIGTFALKYLLAHSGT